HCARGRGQWNRQRGHRSSPCLPFQSLALNAVENTAASFSDDDADLEKPPREVKFAEARAQRRGDDDEGDRGYRHGDTAKLRATTTWFVSWSMKWLHSPPWMPRMIRSTSATALASW